MLFSLNVPNPDSTAPIDNVPLIPVSNYGYLCMVLDNKLNLLDLWKITGNDNRIYESQDKKI